MPVRSRILACVMLLGVASACGGSTTVAQLASASTTTRSGATSTTRVAPTTRVASTTTAADPLEALILVTAPTKYVQQADDVGDTGPSDLAKAAADDGSPDAQSALTSNGFVRGYQRLWETISGDQLIVFLYQFATATGAAAYGSREVDFMKSDASDPAKTFPVPLIPGAVGLGYNDGSMSASAVTFSKGPYLVEVVTNGTSTADTQTLALQMASDQYKRL